MSELPPTLEDPPADEIQAPEPPIPPWFWSILTAALGVAFCLAAWTALVGGV